MLHVNETGPTGRSQLLHETSIYVFLVALLMRVHLSVLCQLLKFLANGRGARMLSLLVMSQVRALSLIHPQIVFSLEKQLVKEIKTS